MTARELPSAVGMPRERWAGRTCVWCGIRLTSGAVSQGIARGRIGAVVLDAEVWACPGCAKKEQACQ
ncbi:hypothetical protein SipoB123_40640 [Streptomyces ipomoeae]|nr:hypothetical protein SipoB123_40640 [Streptomyces ipomoeae]